MGIRPDPDELLQRTRHEESPRGQLKIFLGYAAGVGKTFAMLEAAHQRLDQGVDVVVGLVETHGRMETETFLKGLEVLPRREVLYRGVTFSELSVDAILQRHPAIVLVDEFAHTNAPQSRHPKRYQDVEDILDAGIDVYTTLNVQHIESLNDVVAQVTGVVVNETVPDRLIDEASEIEVIDLPPDELLARLQEGKVYVPDQAARAIQKFFRKGNLTALREMSLRRAAVRVDGQMRDYMRTRAIEGPWPAAGRLMVCISANPLAEKLIRTTRRLADEMGVEWFAVSVDLATNPETNPANRERVGHYLKLAAELGARTRLLTGRSIPETVLAYAHKHYITRIVIGKPIRSRFKEIFTGSVVDRLIYASGDVDVYVISSRSEGKTGVLPEQWRPHSPFWRYLISLGLVALATVLGLLTRGHLDPSNLVVLFLAGTVISALYLGRGPSLLVAITGALAFDFFLVPPFMTLAIDDTQYLLTFLGLLIVSLVISTLTARSREQAEVAIQREAQTSELYNLSRELVSAVDLQQAAEIIIRHIHEAFGHEIAIFLPEKGRLQMYAGSPGYQSDENESAVVLWAYQHSQPAGTGTDTLPSVPLRCEPLLTARGTLGVLAIHTGQAAFLIKPELRQTLGAFANQAALSIERARLAEQARTAERLQITEQLQNALLNSISHELRTPLVSITGALSSLREQSRELSKKDKESLLATAYEEAGRLNRRVGNLLNMTRIESGAIHLKIEPSDIQDAIGTALEQLGERLNGHPVRVDVPGNLPLIPLDLGLFVQALVNVLDNAVKYSPEGSPIDLGVSEMDGKVKIEIGDRGMGIPEQDLERIFDKFYRVQRPDKVSGTGLGLAISKGLIEAQGGSIRAMNRPGGGTVIQIRVPEEEQL